jgi:hypothetical protein
MERQSHNTGIMSMEQGISTKLHRLCEELETAKSAYTMTQYMNTYGLSAVELIGLRNRSAKAQINMNRAQKALDQYIREESEK